MQSYRRIGIFAFLALPVVAFNQTNFIYFKNNDFEICDPSIFPTNSSSLPLSDTAPSGSHFTFTTSSLTAIEFCNSFWNYTVIATTPNDAAFAFTWLSCLSNCISFLISSYFLYRTSTRHGKSSAPDYHELRTTVSDAETTYPTSTQQVTRGLGKIFWMTLTYDSLKTCFWWVSFYQLVRQSTTASRISLLQWITPYQYRVTLRDTLPENRRWLRWAPLALAFLQFGCSTFAAWLMAKTLPLPIDGSNSISTVTYQLTDVAFLSPPGASSLCSRADAAGAVLLSDPAAPLRQLIYFVGSIIAVLLFIPSAWIDLRGGTTRRYMWAYQIYAIGAVEGIMALAIALVRRRSTPLSWDDTCAVVHVMMSPNDGYWDVEITRMWRIVKAWFNV